MVLKVLINKNATCKSKFHTNYLVDFFENNLLVELLRPQKTYYEITKPAYNVWLLPVKGYLIN